MRIGRGVRAPVTIGAITFTSSAGLEPPSIDVPALLDAPSIAASSMILPSVDVEAALGAPTVTEPGEFLPPSIAPKARLGAPGIKAYLLPPSIASPALAGAPSIAETGIQPPSIDTPVEMTRPGIGGELILNWVSAVAKCRLGAPKIRPSGLLPPSISVPVGIDPPILVKLEPPSIAAEVALGAPTLSSPLLVAMPGIAFCRLGLPAVLDAGKAFALYVSGEDKTAYWEQESGIDIQLGLNGKASCKFTVVDTANSYRPSIGHTVQFFFGEDKVFGGVIEDLDESAPSGANTTIKIDVHCNGYGSILDRRVCYGYWDATIDEVSPAFVADSIRVIFLEDDGFHSISTGLQLAPGLDSLFLAPMSVTEAYNRISSATGVPYWVDTDKTIYWVSPSIGEGVAPVSIVQADNAKRIVANSIRVRSLAGLYRNRTFVNVSRAIAANFTETLRKALPTSGNVVWYSSFPIVDAPSSVIASGSNGDFALTVIEGPNLPSVNWDCFFQPGQNFITINPDSPTIQGVGASVATLTATYSIMDGLAGFVYAQDDSQIAARKAIEGGTGLWEAVENATDVETQEQAEALAEGLNATYAENGVPREVTFQADVPGWKPGQILTLDMTRPLASGDFLVTDVGIREHENSLRTENPFLRYSIKCSNAGLLRRRQQNVQQNRGRSVDPITFALARTISGLTNDGLAVSDNVAGVHEITQGGLYADAILVFETPPEGADIILVIQTAEQDAKDWTGATIWVDLVTLTYPAERTKPLITPITGAKARRGQRVRVKCTQVGSDVAGADGTLRIRVLQ